jgi:hypothetical protein
MNDKLPFTMPPAPPKAEGLTFKDLLFQVALMEAASAEISASVSSKWLVASQRETTDLSDAKLAARRCIDTYFRRRGKVIGGTAEALFIAGGPELFDWISKQTPKGSTISETLAAIAVDEMRKESDEADAREVF